MTNDEIDKILATELMGWKTMNVVSPIHGPWMADKIMEYWYVDINTDPGLVATNRNEMREIVKKYYKKRANLWHPMESTDQAYLCEGKLPADIRTAYLGNLMEITTGYKDWDEASWENMFHLVHASPGERCQAIIKTIKDSKP